MDNKWYPIIFHITANFPVTSPQNRFVVFKEGGNCEDDDGYTPDETAPYISQLGYMSDF